jgi:hypothetical protein
MVGEATVSALMLPIAMVPPADRIPGMISVLVPSRARHDMLSRSVYSLRETAAQPDLIEILIAHDPDDPETGEHARQLGAAHVFEAPCRYGYAHSAYYYAELIGHARGEWILPSWGDDGIMLTPGWDFTVRRQSAPSVIFTHGGDQYGNLCFPVVHADVFTYTGHLPELPAIDTWYHDVGKLAGLMVDPVPPIVLTQDRYDISGRNKDQTYVEGRSGYRPGDYYSEPYARQRRQDAETIRETLRAKGFVHAW